MRESFNTDLWGVFAFSNNFFWCQDFFLFFAWSWVPRCGSSARRNGGRLLRQICDWPWHRKNVCAIFPIWSDLSGHRQTVFRKRGRSASWVLAGTITRKNPVSARRFENARAWGRACHGRCNMCRNISGQHPATWKQRDRDWNETWTLRKRMGLSLWTCV